MKVTSTVAKFGAIGLSLLLASCGGGSHNTFTLGTSLNADPALAGRPVNPEPASAERMQMLTSKLEDELKGLGKDISSTTSAVPSDGDQPIDIQAILLDADGNGQTPPYGVKLFWVERLLGDYDQNGVVNVSDLSALGKYFGYKVQYDPPEMHDGVANIPSGDPTDFGADSDGITPQPNSGAFNWRLARIDGNEDGEIGIADLTPMAVHWQESLDGYVVYRQGPDEADYSPMDNPQGADGEMTLRRFDVVNPGTGEQSPLAPVTYSVPDFYLLDEQSVDKTYSYKVAPYNSDSATTGPESDPIMVSPFTSEPPNGGIIPLLSVDVVPPPGSAGAQAQNNEVMGTVPLTVHFDASGSYVPDGNIVNYLWDFDGDGVFEASSGEDPETTHTYTDNARFTAAVKLILIQDPATVGEGGPVSASTTSASATASIVTLSESGNVPPYAHCLADRAYGPSPLTVHFDASTSSDDDGTVETFEWDFDNDGTPDFSSSSPQATYTFGTPALSRVRLKVTDDAGGYDTTMIPVITSNADGNWPPTAVLQVNPTLGSAPLNVTIDGSGSLDPDGAIVSYEWDLNGDFTFDVNTGTNPVFTYTFTDSGVYNVWLRVTDTAGQFDLARTLVNVNTAPFPGLEAIPDSGSGPLTVNFDASSSQDLDGTIVKYEWDFDGDGVYDKDTGILSHVTHTFYKVGTITTILRITDNLGFSSTQSIDIEVRAPKNNLTPTISLSADKTDGPPPLTVLLTATAADPDTDGGIDHYDWDYEGDGIYDESTDVLSPTRTHEYAAGGRFNATVRVVDVAGGDATASVEVLVHQAGNTPPTAAFTVNPIGSPPGSPVTFDASTSMDDSAIADYAWDFDGDGIFDSSGPAANDQVLDHTYSVLGTYVAILKVTDDDGAVDYTWQQIIVGHVPDLTIVSDRDYAEVPNAVFNFDASRSDGVEGAITKFEWDLDGDGTFEISTGVSPFVSAEFQLADLNNYPGGEIHPRLRATNEIGATAITDVIKMPARDPNTGEPLRDADGNLVLDETGQVLLEEVTPIIEDNYDEVEDNDDYLNANFLVGPGAGGTFGPNPTGDRIEALRLSRFLGDDVALTRNDPGLGDYVAGSLGELNLGTIYDGDDNDWYAFELSAGAQVHVDMTFLDKAKTDLNLRLYDANGSTPVAQSLSIDSDEAVDYTFRDPGVYYIRVNRFVGQGQDYKLAMVTTPIDYYPEGHVTDRWDGGTKDADVNNDPGGDPLTSSELADDFQTTILDPKLAYAWGSIDKDTDPEDWYYYNYSAAITTKIECDFSHSQADIDIFLYDQNLSLLGYSNTADDNETIWRALPNPGGLQRLFVRVVAHSGGPANYTLAIGYPAGQPLNLAASDGNSTGHITVSWSPPAPGGNTPNGYALYVSDSEFGYYSLLADQLTATYYVHDLTATEDVPLQNQAFWYKVKATITGQQDSEFSNIDSGYCNGVMAPVGLEVSDSLFLDHVHVKFYDSPADPALGTGLFGLPPLRYEVWADPSDSKPDTLIATFYPGDGESTVVPPIAPEPSRDGEVFEFDWTGLPLWTAAQLQGVPTTFRVVAYNFNNYLLTGDQSAEDTDSGTIAGLQAPTGFYATNGLFSDRIRVSWDDYSSLEPDDYILQFQGEYDSGWTDVSPQPIPHTHGDTQYDYWVTATGGSPPSGKFRLRAHKDGVGYSPWAINPSGYAMDFGYASNMGLATPSYGMNFWTGGADSNGDYWIEVRLGSPSFGTIVPTQWRYRYYRGSWTGWSGYDSFNREVPTRDHSHYVYLTYTNPDSRTIQVEVKWTDPTSPSYVLYSYYSLTKYSGVPIPQ